MSLVRVFSPLGLVLAAAIGCQSSVAHRATPATHGAVASNPSSDHRDVAPRPTRSADRIRPVSYSEPALARDDDDSTRAPILLRKACGSLACSAS